MKIGEKLDELRNNILRDKSDLISGDDDHLWSDATLLRYIKNGERRFARQVLCIRDATTPEVCKVKLKEGVRQYPLHESVLSVLSARYDTDTHLLARSGHSIVRDIAPPEFLSFDPATQYTAAPGRPSAFYTDETLVYARQGRVTLSVYPDPGADQEGLFLFLRVVRLPLAKYTLDDLELESEIPEDYELDPLQWAAHLATSNNDGEAGSARRSSAFAASFDRAVGEAKRETKRKIFAEMGFGFGRNGFSWAR